MRVLVTGASGFLGRSVSDQLLRLGFDVYGLSRNEESDLSRSSKIKWITADLFAPIDVNLLMAEYHFEGLIHLAWETSHGTYWNSTKNLLWVGASLCLFEAFSRCGGKRLVVAGSSAEYHWDGEERLDEFKSPLVPDSLYGVSKNALRQVLDSWAALNNLSWAWGRIFNLFGNGEEEGRLIPRIARKLLNDEDVPFDDGLLYRDFLHVDDAADAFTALFESDVRGAVNIASGEARSIRDIMQCVADLLGKKDLIHFNQIESQLNEPRSVVASTGRLNNEVNWSPSLDFNERLSTTCDWLRTNINQD